MVVASVVIPTHNRVQRLQACLQALCRQTQPAADYEVIVVVDGSTDGTYDMLSNLRTPFALQVIQQPNRGAAVARNRGLAECRSEICILLDDDIVATPDLVAEHLRVHRERRDVVGIGQITLDLVSDADWFACGFAASWTAHYKALNQGLRLPTWQDCYSGNMSAARTTLLELGGFASDLACAHDVELAYRLKEHGCTFIYLSKACGSQDEGKSGRAMAAEAEKRGAASLRLSRRYPCLMPQLLGDFRANTLRTIWMLSLLLALNIAPPIVMGLGWLFARGRGKLQWYHFAYRYCFWRGVKRSLPDRDSWRRLTGGTPILMYHAFGGADERAERFVLPVSRFVRQMAWLDRMGYRVISLQQYVRCSLENSLPAARSVVITIDDGYLDSLSLAYPALRKHGFPATVFPVSSKVGNESDWDSRSSLARRPLLSWQEMKQLIRGGMDIGAHSRTHPRLTHLPPEQAYEEIAGSRTELEQGLGMPIKLFCYPYGDCSPAIQLMVEQAGFSASCTVEEGLNTALTAPHRLRRVEIYGTDSMIQFALAVSMGERASSVRRRIKRWLIEWA